MFRVFRFVSQTSKFCQIKKGFLVIVIVELFKVHIAVGGFPKLEGPRGIE
jgi:hypothetical protein